MADAKARLHEIINAYLDKNSDIVVDTGIVASHIAQMKLFGIRQGVEFFPGQDNFGAQRKDFIDRVLKYNKMDTRLDSIWEYFLCDGKGLFYIRPTKQSYRLYFGGSESRPSTMWGSKVGIFFDFEATEGLDDDAVEATLDTNTYNSLGVGNLDHCR